ncbi:ATP-binding protein [Timonella sp. A28]|uniref:ATP-binding protein n=1 Tax=Timonella sp. A28 TaxID=3442640 RepID=UPI003EB82AA7
MQVSVSPGVGMLALFPSMKYKTWYAIGEFIDNSIQSYLANRDLLNQRYIDNYALEVRVEFDHQNNAIRVTDNAAGIFQKDISRAFTPAVPPLDDTGLSQFGIGMKSAACWFAREFRITTTALGENVKRTVEFNVPLMISSGIAVLEVHERTAPMNEHGTTLELWNLHQKIPVGRSLGAVRDYLRSIYRNYITRDDIRIFVGHDRLLPKEVKILKAPRWDLPESDPLEWKKHFRIVLDDGAAIAGWAALRMDGTYKETGFALSYRKKIVQGADVSLGHGDDLYRPHDIFKGSNSFISLRLFGELDVSEVGVSYSKDAVSWSADTEQEFLEKLKVELDSDPLPLLRMAQNSRKSEAGRRIKNTVDDALHKATQAVLRDAGTAFEKSRSFLEATDVEFTLEDPSIEYRPQEIENFPAPAFGSSETAIEIDGKELLFRVIDEPSGTNFVNVITKTDGGSLIEINRSHKYVLSYGNLPGQDFDAVLRIGIALGLSELRAALAGVSKYKFQLRTINDLLNGELAERLQA